MITKIQNLESYLAAIKISNEPKYTHIRLYRGQPKDYSLLPSLFRKYQNHIGFLKSDEEKIIQSLKEKIPENTPQRPYNDWDWLSFGQHFSLPTRLLDWSECPLIALFFALEGNAVEPTVYIYHAQKLQIVDKKTLQTQSPFLIDKTRIMKPSVHSHRVGLQKGWHTVHRIHPKKSGGEILIPLEEMDWHEGRIKKIIIDPLSVENLKRELAQNGIYHSTVYGNFEKICEEISTTFEIESKSSILY